MAAHNRLPPLPAVELGINLAAAGGGRFDMLVVVAHIAGWLGMAGAVFLIGRGVNGMTR